MTDLTSRITAALDEQQRLAEAATPGPWVVGPTFGARDNRVYVKAEYSLIDTVGTCVIAGQVANVPEFRANAAFIAANDPSSVLRRVAAQRRVLERHYRDGECCVGCGRGEYGDYRELFVQCPELLDLADAVGVDVTGVEA